MPKQHRSKKIAAVLAELETYDFIVEPKTRRGTIKIIPPKGVKGSVYFTHGTESSYHQIKRDFKKLYNIEIVS